VATTVTRDAVAIYTFSNLYLECVSESEKGTLDVEDFKIRANKTLSEMADRSQKVMEAYEKFIDTVISPPLAIISPSIIRPDPFSLDIKIIFLFIYWYLLSCLIVFAYDKFRGG
jgi:hypothetical protein